MNRLALNASLGAAVDAGNVAAARAVMKHRSPLTEAERSGYQERARRHPQMLAWLSGQEDRFVSTEHELEALLRTKNVGAARQMLLRNPQAGQTRVAASSGGANRAPWSHELVRAQLASSLQDVLSIDSLNVVDSTGANTMHLAASYGHTQLIARGLQTGAAVWQLNHDGLTPFHMACLTGRLDIVTMLLEARPDAVNLSHASGLSPLDCAVISASSSVMEYLLQHGANPNQLGYDHHTPLSRALNGGHLLIAGRLLQENIDFQQRIGADGGSYLHQAVKLDAPSILAQLLACGCTQRADSKGNLPTHVAAQANMVQALRFLGANDPTSLNTGNHVGQTPLDVAAAAGSRKAMAFLLASGARLGEVSKNLPPTIAQAAQKGGLPVINALVAHGADLTAENDLGFDALGAAGQSPNQETFEVLKKSPEFSGSERQERAAGWAALLDKSQALDSLLAGGSVDPNATWMHRTLLETAAARGAAKAVAALIRHGANLDSAAGAQTPLQLAVAGGHTQCAQLLLSAGAGHQVLTAEHETLLHLAVKSGQIATLLLVLRKEIDVDELNIHGASALEAAVTAGQVDMARALLAFRGHADGLRTDDWPDAYKDLCTDFVAHRVNGEPRLHSAVRNGWAHVLPSLSAVDGIDKANANGQTALHVSSSANCTRVLLALGADATLEDAGKRTAWQLAVENRALECAELLRPSRGGSRDEHRNLLMAAYRAGDRAMFLRLARSRSTDDVGPLANAARGSVDGLIATIAEHGLPSGTKLPNGSPILFEALAIPETCKFFVDWLGFRADVVDEATGDTAMHRAAATGNLAITKLLLERQPELLHLTNSSGYKPLALALRSGVQELIDDLVPRASINEDDDLGCSQIAPALRDGEYDLVEKFIRLGARVYVDSPGDPLAQMPPTLLCTYARAVNASSDVDTALQRAAEDAADKALQGANLIRSLTQSFTQATQPDGFSGLVDTRGEDNGYSVRYLGRVRHGNMDGQGTLTIRGPNGTESSSGTWRNNVLDGFGTEISANGVRFDGFMANGVRHGRALITHPGEEPFEIWYDHGAILPRWKNATEFVGLFDPVSGLSGSGLQQLLTDFHRVYGTNGLRALDRNGHSLWHWAIVRNSPEMLKQLMTLDDTYLTRYPTHSNAPKLVQLALKQGSFACLRWLHQQGRNLRADAPDVAHACVRGAHVDFARWFFSTYPQGIKDLKDGQRPWEVATQPAMRALLAQYAPRDAASASAHRGEVEELVSRGSYRAAASLLEKHNLADFFRDGPWMACRAQICWHTKNTYGAAVLANEAIRLGESSPFLFYIRFKDAPTIYRADRERLLKLGRQNVEAFGGDWRWLSKVAI